MYQRINLARPRQDPYAGSFLGLSLLIVGLATPLLILAPGIQSLEGCDESFYAQMGREMLAGAWLSPTYLGELFFEKPPLLMGLVALSFKVGGINEWSARLPGILSALAAIPLVGWIGRQFLPARAAVLGMCALPLCFLWLQQGRMVGQDIPLTLIELMGIAGLIAGIQGRRGWYWLTGLCLGLGLLMKSAMILLVGVAVLPYLLQQQRHWLTSPHFWLGQLSGLSLFGLWLGVSMQRHGSQVWQSLLGKVQDLGAEPFHADHRWFYYLWHIPVHGFPWTVLGVIGGLMLIRRYPGRSLLIWSLPLILVALLTVYPTRTHYYTVQLYPWLVLMAGVVIDQAMLKWRERGMDMRPTIHLAQWLSRGFVILGILLVGLGVATLVGVDELELLSPHALALLGMGICYTLLPLIWAWRHLLHSPASLWVGSLYLASGIAMISVVNRADFGNHNPALAQLRQSWNQQVITLDPIEQVDIGRSGLEDVCQAQAYAFYTPIPGRLVGDEALLADDFGLHLWLSPVQQERYEPLLTSLQPVIEVEGWQLMERIQAVLPEATIDPVLSDLELDPTLEQDPVPTP
ncbi:MAG: ArnT family glycosyltransferase [Cyanophyceae cyanobacterium]